MQISGINFEVGMTREKAIKDNNADIKAGVIFDCINTNGNETIDEDEIKQFAEANKPSEDYDTPESKKITKLEAKYDEVFKKITELEKEIGELEQLRASLYTQINNNKNQDEVKKLSKDYKDIDKRLNKKYSEREKLLKKSDKYSSQILFLQEVKQDTKLSEKDLIEQSQQYIQQRNQLNPYYAKYQELTTKVNTEEDPNKREQYYQEWRILDELVANWRPSNSNFQVQSAGSFISGEVVVRNNTNETITSANLSASTKLKNHTLSVNTGLTRQSNEEENSESTNIGVGISDNIDIGENSNLTLGSNYTNYALETPDTKQSNQTWMNNINFQTRLNNVSLNASYTNTYSQNEMTSGDNTNKGQSLQNTFSAGMNHSIKHFNYGVGTIVDFLKSKEMSQNSYSLPVTAGVNFGDKHKFNVTGLYTPTFGDTKSSSYGTNLSYNYSSDAVAFESSGSFMYTHDSQSGDSYNYGASSRLTNKKHGFSAGVNFMGSNNKFNKTYDISGTFVHPMTDSSRLTVGGGYNNNTGAYGQVSVAFDINTKRKKH